MNRNGPSGVAPGPEEASARANLGPKEGRPVPHFDGGWISAGEVKTWLAASNQSVEQAMFDLIPLARTFAKPTLSGFKVGAVAQGASGALYLGANVEFPRCAVNQTVHAEQAAVINAWHHEDTGLSRLAVSAAPCGYCRQFLFELATADQLEILLAGHSPQRLATLLPGAFGPRDLGGSGRLAEPGASQTPRGRHRRRHGSSGARSCHGRLRPLHG